MTQDLQVLEDPADAEAVLREPRLGLIGALREKPDSAAGLARRLELPRQRVNYHLRELEARGVLRCVEERRRRGFTERVMAPKAGSLIVSPGATGPLSIDPGSVADRASAAYLTALAARAITEVTRIVRAASKKKQRVATLGVDAEVRFASAESRAAFGEELASAVAQLAAKYHDQHAEGGRVFRVAALCHPAVTREIENDKERKDDGR